MKIGIDIGGTHLAVGLVNNRGKIIYKEEKDWTEEDKKDMKNAIKKNILNIIKSILKKTNTNIETISKIGIGYTAMLIKDDEKKEFLESIEKELNKQVSMRNDAKCAALCEKKYGNLKEYKNIIFLTIGTGIGGAYFYNSKLVKPTNKEGFEVGHMVIEKNGLKCRCGKRGCFEEYASIRALKRKIKEEFNIKENIDSNYILNMSEQKEHTQKLYKIIDEYTENLKIGIINLIEIFEPDVICIGGSFSYYKNLLLEPLTNKINNELNRKIKIILAEKKNDAGIIGAVI